MHTGAMADPLPDPKPLNDALRRLHRSALTSLAACAVGIGIAMLTRSGGPAGKPAATYSWIAIALAAAAILLRRPARRPHHALRRFLYGTALSMLAATGLGVLGIVVTLRESQTTTGLLYTLAGALLVLRPPPVLGPPSSGPE